MFEAFSREELEGMLLDAGLNWLAHDGLWFRSVEDRFGLDTAIELDAEAWEGFAVIEAKRIMRRHAVEPGGGLGALATALQRRFYSFINKHAILEQSDTELVFAMKECRVQTTRQKKGLPDFPCKPVGTIEYTSFASTIDSRIKTRCLGCPPDAHRGEWFCAWEFTLPPNTE
jgi:hypothetical protein